MMFTSRSETLESNLVAPRVHVYLDLEIPTVFEGASTTHCKISNSSFGNFLLSRLSCPVTSPSEPTPDTPAPHPPTAGPLGPGIGPHPPPALLFIRSPHVTAVRGPPGDVSPGARHQVHHHAVRPIMNMRHSADSRPVHMIQGCYSKPSKVVRAMWRLPVSREDPEPASPIFFPSSSSRRRRRQQQTFR
jgi:hypothetical protein